MIYLFENLNKRASVVYDDSTLSKANKMKGVAVEKLPEKEEVEGKQAILKCDKSTERVWYEYEDILPTEEDLTKQEIEQLKADNGELLMKQAIQDIELTQSKSDIGELMIKVATLELGGNL